MIVPVNEIHCPELWFDHMILVDGMARSGKSLVAACLANFDRVEPWQIPIYVDHVVKYLELGEFSRNGARAALRNGLNSHAFDYAVGRGLNRRRTDWSTVTHFSPQDLLIEREQESSYEVLLQHFRDSKRIPTFVTHEQISFTSLWFDSVPSLKFLEVCRHPATLMVSWYRRRLTDRWGEDPLLFVPCMSVNEKPVPLFARDIQDRWSAMTTEEKLLASLELQYANLWCALDTLSDHDQLQLRWVQIESLKERPRNIVVRLSEWLDCDVSQIQLDAFMAREKLPRQDSGIEVASALKELQAILSGSLIERLRILVEEYEDQTKTHAHLLL